MNRAPSVTQAILTAMRPNLEYRLRDIRRQLRNTGITDKQLRNGLHGLTQSGRLLKRGRAWHYLYRLNLDPPTLKPGAAAVTQSLLSAVRSGAIPEPILPANAPTWPAMPPAERFDRNPAWRIAA